MTFISSAKSLTDSGRRRGERGQTILLVAISIVTLLAMAALAIDVVSLYVASTEIQRAADAAALAGAKAIADSGVTTLRPGDGNLVDAENLAQSMARAVIQGLLQASPPINQVAGGSPVLVGNPVISWAQGNGNPQITITLQQPNLPTFFARVFGRRSAIATASATAEAYNPANLASFTPIQTTCVKPWLVGNMDPITGNPFVTNTATGQVEDAVGETAFYLSPDCAGNNNSCFNLHVTPPGSGTVPAPFVYFVPLLVTPNAGDILPSATASPCGGGNNPSFKNAVEGCSITPYSCGGTTPNANWDQTVNPGFRRTNSDLAEGTECLIHASGEGGGLGQDTLDWTTAPFPSGPPRILSGSGPQIGNYVSTSSSIVTIPIIDNATFSTTPPYPVTIVGFLHAFINEVDDLGAGHHSDVQITILNIVGCSQTPNGNAPAIGGNGASPIPVRLISPQ